jgi:hypothetical protein
LPELDLTKIFGHGWKLQETVGNCVLGTADGGQL